MASYITNQCKLAVEKSALLKFLEWFCLYFLVDLLGKSHHIPSARQNISLKFVMWWSRVQDQHAYMQSILQICPQIWSSQILGHFLFRGKHCIGDCRVQWHIQWLQMYSLLLLHCTSTRFSERIMILSIVIAQSGPWCWCGFHSVYSSARLLLSEAKCGGPGQQQSMH